MGTIYQYLTPESASFRAGFFPAYVINQGTDFPVSGLAFDATNDESAFWKFSPLGWPAGAAMTIDVIWYADTSTTATHTAYWQVAFVAITPSADTTNVETEPYGQTTAVTTDLGSTNAQKLMKTTIPNSAGSPTLDSAAAGDEVWLRVTRTASNANDDLTGDAILTSVRVSYPDT